MSAGQTIMQPFMAQAYQIPKAIEVSDSNRLVNIKRVPC